MITTTVSTKGQVTLPKAIRDQKHWSAGTKLIVEDTAEGVLLKAAPIFAPSDIDAREWIADQLDRGRVFAPGKVRDGEGRCGGGQADP